MNLMKFRAEHQCDEQQYPKSELSAKKCIKKTMLNLFSGHEKVRFLCMSVLCDR